MTDKTQKEKLMELFKEMGLQFDDIECLTHSFVNCRQGEHNGFVGEADLSFEFNKDGSFREARASS